MFARDITDFSVVFGAPAQVVKQNDRVQKAWVVFIKTRVSARCINSSAFCNMIISFCPGRVSREEGLSPCQHSGVVEHER
jgi:hypothetical protein